jgi:hypothetical protein
VNQKRHDEGHEQDLDAPTPPGGPNRTDAPAGSQTPGTPARDPGPAVQRVTEREDPVDPPPPAHDDEREQSAAAAQQQEANAEESEFGEPSQ